MPSPLFQRLLVACLVLMDTLWSPLLVGFPSPGNSRGRRRCSSCFLFHLLPSLPLWHIHKGKGRKKVSEKIAKGKAECPKTETLTPSPALTILPLSWGGAVRSCNKRLVTICLLPALLLALHDIQLFDQLVIALPHVRGSGHRWGPLFSLLLYWPTELFQPFGMPVGRTFEEKQNQSIGRVVNTAAWRQVGGLCLCSQSWCSALLKLVGPSYKSTCSHEAR